MLIVNFKLNVRCENSKIISDRLPNCTVFFYWFDLICWARFNWILDKARCRGKCFRVYTIHVRWIWSLCDSVVSVSVKRILIWFDEICVIILLHGSFTVIGQTSMSHRLFTLLLVSSISMLHGSDDNIKKKLSAYFL